MTTIELRHVSTHSCWQSSANVYLILMDTPWGWYTRNGRNISVFWCSNCKSLYCHTVYLLV